jgi:hypothetical protein
MRLAILKRIGLQSVSADGMTLRNLVEGRRKLHFDHLGVEVRVTCISILSFSGTGKDGAFHAFDLIS